MPNRPPPTSPPTQRLSTPTKRYNLAWNEQQVIQRALQAAKGSKYKAARLLGISRSTLYRKLEKYNCCDEVSANDA